MSGKNIKGYEMTHNFDIDTEQDFLKVEKYMRLLEGNKKVVFPSRI